MKTLFKSLLSLLFVAALTLNLNAKDIAPELSLKNEIKAMMKGVVLPQEADFKATVQFLVNDENQIVIVSVDSDENFMERVIKSRLNYKKIKSTEAAPNKINRVTLILKGT